MPESLKHKNTSSHHDHTLMCLQTHRNTHSVVKIHIYDFLFFLLFSFSSSNCRSVNMYTDSHTSKPSVNLSNRFSWPHYTLAVSNCVFVFVPLACDDECSGLLISDMDRLYRIITEVTLTTPLPPPYQVLYRFENMTEELKVQSVSAYL